MITLKQTANHKYNIRTPGFLNSTDYFGLLRIYWFFLSVIMRKNPYYGLEKNEYIRNNLKIIRKI